MIERYIIKRNTATFPFLVLTEYNKYEWGAKKDAALFTRAESKKIQMVLAFKTSIEKYNQSLHSDGQGRAAEVREGV